MARMVYVYVDGSDLHECAEQLTASFGDLAERWKGLGACLVNRVHERTPDMQPEDLADWFLGINLPRQQFGTREVDELLPFLQGLARASGREFILGIAQESGITEDLVFIGANCGEAERQFLLLHVAGL